MMAGCASSSASIEPPVPVPQVEPINDANETEESKVEESNPEVGESKKNQEDELNEGKKDNIYQKRRRFKGKKPWFLRSPADEQRRQERRNKRLKVVMNHRTRLLNYL